MMLTDDEAVADPVRRITQAADEELEAFEAAISVSDGVVDEDRRLVEQLRDTIQTAMLELVEYGRQNLRVATNNPAWRVTARHCHHTGSIPWLDGDTHWC